MIPMVIPHKTSESHLNRQFLYTMIAVGLVTVCGVLLRLLCYWRNPILSRDSITYLMMAQDWCNEGILPSDKGFIFLISYGRFCDLPLTPSAFWLIFIMGCCIPWAAMWSAMQILGDWKEAILCSIICAFHPVLIKTSCVIQREIPYTLFLLFGVGAFYRYWRKRQIIWGVISGSCIALATLMREDGIDLLFVALLLMLIRSLHGYKWRQLLLDWGILIVSFAGVFLLFLWLMGNNMIAEILSEYAHTFTQQLKRFQ